MLAIKVPPLDNARIGKNEIETILSLEDLIEDRRKFLVVGHVRFVEGSFET